jgi:hypothetical protein
MVGGLLQLKEKGAQDLYLTGQPQITFFKTVYRRYTNFSIESIEQLFDNPPGKDNSCNINIDRKGDLIHKIYLEQEIPTNASFIDEGNKVNYGYNFLKKVDLLIGNKLIDSHTSNWLETYAELTQPNEYGNFTSAHNALFMNSAKNVGIGHDNNNNDRHTATKFQSMCMAGGVDEYDFLPWHDGTQYNASSTNADPLSGAFTNFKRNSKLIPNLKTNASITTSASATTVNNYGEYLFNNEHHYIYTPLQFWFCRNIGLALPLIALQYSEVSIEILFSKFITSNVENQLKMYIDYIYLDTDERRRFSQISHEYLIEQVQTFKNINLTDSNLLSLNHPVKELIWVSGNGEEANYGSKSLKGKWNLQINGYDRFTERDITYFTKQQVNDYHSGYGGVTTKNSIAVYSFALHPEDHQPSGTMNFSAIKNAYLICNLYNGQTATDETYTLYAVNYNILRILSGSAGLGYV